MKETTARNLKITSIGFLLFTIFGILTTYGITQVSDSWVNTTHLVASTDISLNAKTISDWEAVNKSNYINVKDYGAKGDGITNDTAAINAAYVACEAGDTLYFPNGTYYFGDNFGIYKPLQVKGDGIYQTKFICKTNIPWVIGIMYTDNVTFRDFQVDAMNTCGGVKTGYSNYTIIDNLFIHNIANDTTITKHCLDIKGTHVTVMNSRMERCLDDGIAISGNDSKFVHVHNNFIYNIPVRKGAGTGPSGIEVDDGASHVIIEQNTVQSTGTGAIDVHMHDGYEGPLDITISNNYVEGGQYGISVYLNSGTAVKDNRNIIISNNHVHDSAVAGIYLDHCWNCLIIGNNLVGNRKGMEIKNTNMTTVSNNHISEHDVLAYSLLSNDASANNKYVVVDDSSAFVAGSKIWVKDDLASEEVTIQEINGNILNLTTRLVNAYTQVNNAYAKKKETIIGIEVISGNKDLVLWNNMITRQTIENIRETERPTFLSVIHEGVLGIGTDTPYNTENIHVLTNTTANLRLESTNTDYSPSIKLTDPENSWRLKASTYKMFIIEDAIKSSSPFQLQQNVSTNMFVIGRKGVGINTNNPTKTLTVNGNVTISETLALTGTRKIDLWGGNLQIGNGVAPGSNLTMTSQNGNEWCCGVDNAGNFLCRAGSC